MKFDIQKADFWKRISAFLFDFILLGTLIIGLAAALSSILNYDKYTDMMKEARYDAYDLYGIPHDITAEEFEKLPEETRIGANKAYSRDSRAVYGSKMSSNLRLIIISLSIITAHVLLELVVPLLFGNGQTLGKKAFGLAVMHTNGVKLKNQAHFVRVIVGKCTIETMVPAYIVIMIIFGNLGAVGTVVLGLFALLQIFSVFYTRATTRSAIHDLISDTVVVDMASQQMFDTFEDLMAYKTRLHEEEVAKQDY